MTAYDNTREELRQLRKQVDELMESRVTPMLSDAAQRASDAAHRARDYTGVQAEAVSDKVRDMPLVSIGIAAAVGFLLGRFTR
jgi:ElaB/YqjD/DUF883 family membrane-anchored ribosome-binding protein